MCRSKTKIFFGKKQQPDSPRLPKKDNSKWSLQDQEQWVRQEPLSSAHFQARPHSTQGNHQQTAGQQQQKDWYSAALQQSAQLGDIAKQEESFPKDTLLPKEGRHKPGYMRRRAAAGQAAFQDEDWFGVAP